MTEEYITKKQVFGAIDAVVKLGDGIGTLWHEIHFITPADVAPVRHGRWREGAYAGYRCSECRTTWDAPTNYCPNCGADMKEAGNG